MAEQRWLIRTRLSGVWVDAEMLPPVEGQEPHEFRIRGRRLHRWTRGALACGDLARLGAPEGSRLETESEPLLQWPDVAERHLMGEPALAATRRVPSWSP